MKNRYKDLKATAILLAIIGSLTGISCFVRYAPHEYVEFFFKSIAVLIILVLLLIIWKFIRILLD